MKQLPIYNSIAILAIGLFIIGVVEYKLDKLIEIAQMQSKVITQLSSYHTVKWTRK